MNLAFLTSGGDSSGMNPCIRAITRQCLFHNITPFAIIDGYTGLLNDSFEEFNWESVSDILYKGGTHIRTSRCDEFLDPLMRRRGALNLLKRNISKLIVIGGDGSILGAYQFYKDWSNNVDFLFNQGLISESIAVNHHELKLVCIAASIDNDVYGTEYTIGSITALHRCIECIDSISTTSYSHSRAIVIEVMGRNCGWLGLSTFIASNADYVLIPEIPLEYGWKNNLCNSIIKKKKEGKCFIIIILSEGAKDLEGLKILPEEVCKTVYEFTGIDCRHSILGYIQRGGSPALHDRVFPSLQGCNAVTNLFNESIEVPKMIGLASNKIVFHKLEFIASKIQEAKNAIITSNYKTLLELRGLNFKFLLNILNDSKICNFKPSNTKRILVCTVGAPCCGMNEAIYAIKLFTENRGYSMLISEDGFQGITENRIKEFDIAEYYNIVGKGGSILGANRTLPSDFTKIDKVFTTRHIEALILIGGFECLKAYKLLNQHRENFASFCIPILYIPATVSNNIPGTDVTLGSDTALNIIMNACDIVKQSAKSSHKRVFIVEVQGGNCGYLALVAGIASGASDIYIPEIPFNLKSLAEKIQKLRANFLIKPNQGRLVICNENFSNSLNVGELSRLYQSESNEAFDARWIVLGHIQQGNISSPLDRIRGIGFTFMLLTEYESNAKSCISKDLMASIKGDCVEIIPIEHAIDIADFLKRVSNVREWLNLTEFINILSW